MQLSLDVADFLYNSNKKYMFIDAPVGTGKTLGILIPALMNAKDTKKQIVYATATRNLQNQIMIGNNSEINILSKVNLINSFQSVLAMGKNNYFCQSVFEENKKKFSPEEIKAINEFIKNNKYGTKDELESYGINLSDNRWKLLSLSKSKSCGLITCPGHEYRKRFLSNQLITVTNQSQLINSINNGMSGNNPIINNNPGIIIVDEAHDFESNFLNCIETEFNIQNFSQLIRSYPEIKNKYYVFQTKLQEKIRASRSKKGQIKFDDDIKKSIKELRKCLFDIDTKLQKKIRNSQRPNPLLMNSLLEETEKVFAAIINDDRYTSWYSIENKTICITTNDFVDSYHKFIKQLSIKNKVIFMSGTLATKNNYEDNKREIVQEWTLKENKYVYKKYSNELDLTKQVYFYTPKDLSETKRNNVHISEVNNYSDKLINLLKDSGVLILCTSYESMDSIAEYVKNKFHNRRILIQGERSTVKLSEEFKKCTDSILIGSGSFFSGFSVPGKALRGLLIDKLPYPVPDDPLMRLKSKGITKKQIKELYLQTMLKKLEQGLGRLIRKKDDYGVAMIIDPRVISNKDINDWLLEKGYKIHQSLNDYDPTSIKLNIDNLKSNVYNQNKINIPVIFSEKKTNQIELKPQNKIYSLEEVQKWTKKYMSELRKKNKLNIRGNYRDKRACFQTLVNVYSTSNELDLKNASFYEEFPYDNEKQRENFKRISCNISGTVVITSIKR